MCPNVSFMGFRMIRIMGEIYSHHIALDMIWRAHDFSYNLLTLPHNVHIILSRARSTLQFAGPQSLAVDSIGGAFGYQFSESSFAEPSKDIFLELIHGSS